MAKVIVQVIAFLFLFLLTSCATPYQSKGFSGGYEDTHIKDNIYFVEFTSNAYTSFSVTAKYFHRRAKEVCEENGYKDYRITSEKDISGMWGTASYGGGTGSISTQAKPGSAGYVECLKVKN